MESLQNLQKRFFYTSRTSCGMPDLESLAR